MADNKQRFTSLALTLLLFAANLIAFNALLAGRVGLRVDLTEEDLYSISPATRRLLAGLEEDVSIYGFFSQRTHPKLAPLVPQIEDLLDEYRALSRGRVRVEIIDPGEDEEAEREATSRFGVQSTPFRLASKYESGIVNAYFAIVVKYGDQYVRYGFDDLIEIEPLPDGDIEVRLRNPEYDLTRAIKKAAFGFRSTAELFERVEENVRFIAVMTPDALPEVFKEIPDAVRSAAGQLAEQGGDSFSYEELDPLQSDEVRLELADRYGVGPMSLGFFGDTQFYLYGFLEIGNQVEQLDLVGEGVSAASIREAIENSLRRRTPGFLKTVGVVAPRVDLPPELMMQMQMQGRMPPPEFEQVKLLLRRDYEVRDVTLGSGQGVPSDIDTLVVLKPKNLDERAVYELDQYLMRGGRVILGAGNFEVNFDQAGLQVRPVQTGLDDWLGHHGVSVAPTLVLDDRNQPLPIPELRQTAFGTIRTWTMAPYPYLVEVRDEGLVNREVAAQLGAMGIYWGSPVHVNEEAAGELEVVEILRSSERSWTDDDVTRTAYVDYEVPAEGLESQLLAVALSGEFASHFEEREAPRAAPPAQDDAADAPPPTEVPLERSPETRLVVIGNAEFLSDFVARSLGMTDGGFFDANLAFMQNLIDWVNLDSDLIGIRSRGAAARRLVRVDRSTEVAIETMAYVVPIGILIALAGYRIWRRRNTEPIIARSGR